MDKLLDTTERSQRHKHHQDSLQTRVLLCCLLQIMSCWFLFLTLNSSCLKPQPIRQQLKNSWALCQTSERRSWTSVWVKLSFKSQLGSHPGVQTSLTSAGPTGGERDLTVDEVRGRNEASYWSLQTADDRQLWQSNPDLQAFGVTSHDLSCSLTLPLICFRPVQSKKTTNHRAADSWGGKVELCRSRSFALPLKEKMFKLISQVDPELLHFDFFCFSCILTSSQLHCSGALCRQKSDKRSAQSQLPMMLIAFAGRAEGAKGAIMNIYTILMYEVTMCWCLW